MQVFGPRISTLNTLYSAAAIQKALTQSGREQYVWDLLDSGNRPIADLTGFVEKAGYPPSVAYDTTLAVKRTVSLRLRGDAPIYKGGVLSLASRIRGHYQIRMPDGGYVDFPIGTFVVLPAGGEVWPARAWHDLAGTDYGQLLLDYNFITSASVPAGVSGVQAVGSLLSIPGLQTPIPMLIPDLGRSLAQPIAWDPGMSRLKAINDILIAIGYFPAWFDEVGVMRSEPLPDWNSKQPAFAFDGTAAGSIVRVPIQQSVDWSGAGNIQTVYVEDPRRPTFSATYVNSNPLSPISVNNYHPKSLQPYKDSSIPDVTTAGAIARHLCQLAARVYQTWSVDTFAWPVGQDQDVYSATYTEPDDGTQHPSFVEMGWTIKCKAGQATTHKFQQLVAA